MKPVNPQIVTVFYNDVALHLVESHQQNDLNVLFIGSRSDLVHCLDRFFSSHTEDDIHLKANDLDKLFENFKSYFKFVQAAGGLVKNENKELLLIKRFGIWDLPKGKLEKNEDIETCAIREVSEETGVNGLKIIDRLPSTYHIYFRDGKTILKETNWYHMSTPFLGKLKPQTKEGITEAVWKDRKESFQALSQSYRSIRDMLLPYLTI